MVKGQYREKVESCYSSSNTRLMWRGLRTITDYKGKRCSAGEVPAPLPEELNSFYTRFENHTKPEVLLEQDNCPLQISRQTCKFFKKVNAPPPHWHRCPAGMCAGPPAVLPIHPRLHGPTRLCQVPRPHHRHRLFHRWRRVSLQSNKSNNLLLNVGKNKEMIVDWRGGHAPIHMEGTAVERVSCEDLSWSQHTDSETAAILFAVIPALYKCTIESVLAGSITVWYGSCPALECKALQRVVRSAQRITRTELPTIQDLYSQCCRRKAQRILSDLSHPRHRLFTLLPSGRWYRSIRTHTSRFRDSFYPQAIRLLNC
ncbi:hypothetical protein N1851_014495 [Merluccius polli]|uniref:Uncharacterized protein n=1 Tax=Merluccius polli TaxID=89951 RepID=A0AA47P484_MERPO|nr:hypothetical protein N1851_014495 [Merluccius polli]